MQTENKVKTEKNEAGKVSSLLTGYSALNLYAGLGGNRALWPDHVKVTAVEHDPEIARAYQDRFPDDVVVVGDAHVYLLDNYQRFDFIWSSPPYPSHGQYRYNVGVKAKGYKGLFPDMRLYEEIIFLKYHHKGKYAVENTISYYEPLVTPQKVARHYLWANFHIPDLKLPAANIRSKNKISDWEDELGISLAGYKIPNKRQTLRNCVNSKLGAHVLSKAV